jgi:hypothetical protein
MGQNAIYLRKGPLVAAPASDEVALIVESDGSPKLLAANGTRTAIGGSSPTYFAETLVADTTDYTFPSLNGNQDGDYEFFGVIVVPSSGTPTYSFQPNGLATNQDVELYGSNNGAALNTRFGFLRIAGLAGAAGAYVAFRIRFAALAGKQRFFECTVFDSTGATPRGYTNTGIWTDTSTNLTSAVIHADTASAIKAGTWIGYRALGVKT